PVTESEHMAAMVIVLLAAAIGANYGANLSLFPSFTKDLWGLKNFGVNYGILFTAWGVGGFVLPFVQQRLTEKSRGSYTSSFIAAGTLLVLGAILTLFLQSRSKEKSPITSPPLVPTAATGPVTKT